jgi:hypothetical protein
MPGPYTVTATLNTTGSAALQGNAFVRFKLRNFAGFVPRVAGTAVIAETQIDAFPNGSGLVSQLVWGNSDLTPSTTFYTIEFWDQGRITSTGNYLVNANMDLGTSGQINTPPPPPGFTFVLQTNEVVNGSQTLLDLHAGPGVTLTDNGTGRVTVTATGTGFNTPGVGGFFSAGFPLTAPYGQALAGTNPSTTINQVSVFQFTLSSPFTISRVSCYVAIGVASQTANFGIYDSNGNKLLDSGALNAGTSATTASNAITPVTLPVGTYYFAQSTSNTSIQITGFALNSAQLDDMVNAGGTVKNGQAANSTSGGVMPSTLGTITADTIRLNMAAAFFAV